MSLWIVYFFMQPTNYEVLLFELTVVHNRSMYKEELENEGIRDVEKTLEKQDRKSVV